MSELYYRLIATAAGIPAPVFGARMPIILVEKRKALDNVLEMQRWLRLPRKDMTDVQRKIIEDFELNAGVRYDF